MSLRKRKIALIIAMKEEAKPLIESLQLERTLTFGDPRLPFEHYSGSYGDQFELLISTNGLDSRYGVDCIGTEPATLNTYITLERFQPQLCMNVGTAGGFIKHNAKIGEVYLSAEAFRFHDRRIPIPNFDHYGIGHYPAYPLPKMVAALQLKEGVVSTGNSLDATDTDLAIMESHNGSVKEMEAAGIAWVCHQLRVPFFALKAITDLVDSHVATEEEFVKNLKTASQNLRSKTLLVLEYLAMHPEEFPNSLI